jgi:hypothetical protein
LSLSISRFQGGDRDRRAAWKGGCGQEWPPHRAAERQPKDVTFR